MGLGGRSTLGLCLALTVMGSAGCIRYTQPITHAHADPGGMGFGASDHVFIMYAVLAASRTDVFVTARAAFSPSSGVIGDGAWEVYGGGGHMRYCVETAQGPMCAQPEIPRGIPLLDYVVIDPVNLGRFLAITQTSGSYSAGGATYFYTQTTSSGSLVIHDEQQSAAATRGVWITDTAHSRLLHCAAEPDLPRCREVMMNGALLSPTSVLGVFQLETPGRPPAEVLWAQPGFGDPVRCTVDGGQFEVMCTPVQMPEAR